MGISSCLVLAEDSKRARQHKVVAIVAGRVYVSVPATEDANVAIEGGEA
jgi:hypothetical protein